MSVNSAFELKSHKNPDNKACTNDITVVITYPVDNNTAKAYNSVFRIRGFNYEYVGISGTFGSPTPRSSKIKSITYYNPGGFGAKDSLKSMTIELPGTDVYTIDILLCTVIKEVDYDVIVSSGLITSGGKLPSIASAFAVFKDNGDILYLYRTTGSNGNLSNFQSTSEFDNVISSWTSVLTSDTDELKSTKNFIYFCEEEKKINCNIQKFNNEAIESFNNISICEESECDCGNLKNTIKGYIITQFLYQIVQRHVDIVTVDMNPNYVVPNPLYYATLQILINNSDIDNLRTLLSYYKMLFSCSDSCESC